MILNVKTSAEKEFHGICPECHEHTTAGDSCCGAGAYVEGGLVTDEEAQETAENPTVCVRLLVDTDEDRARAVKKALFEAGLSATMFTHHPTSRDHWNVNVFVPVENLVTEEIQGRGVSEPRVQGAGWMCSILEWGQVVADVYGRTAEDARGTAERLAGVKP